MKEKKNCEKAHERNSGYKKTIGIKIIGVSDICCITKLIENKMLRSFAAKNVTL